MKKYSIDLLELGIPYADAGQWRSYHLIANGDNLQELLDDATIVEVDQDGGYLVYYEVSQGPYAVEMAALRAIYETAGVEFDENDPYKEV